MMPDSRKSPQDQQSPRLRTISGSTESEGLTAVEFDTDEHRILRWSSRDLEQRFFFAQGGRFTQVNVLTSGILAALLTTAFYLLLSYIVAPLTDSATSPLLIWLGTVCEMLTERGPTQHATVLLSFWSALILSLKWSKLKLQREALSDEYRVVNPDPGFVVASGTVDRVLKRLHDNTDDPRNFVVFNRILIALSNLKNLGRVSDVDDVLRSQAENDESLFETSYSVVSGFVWAIPVLGFIGTVLGLSQAIGQFGEILKQSADMENIKLGLKGVTNGLATAFETTLVALVAALVIQLWLIVLKKSEQEFLDDCSDYCLRNVVNRLRMSSYEDERN